MGGRGAFLAALSIRLEMTNYGLRHRLKIRFQLGQIKAVEGDLEEGIQG